MLVSLPLILMLILQGMSPSQALMVVSAASENPVFRVAIQPKDANQQSVKTSSVASSRQRIETAFGFEVSETRLESVGYVPSVSATCAGFGSSDRTRDGPTV